MLNLQLKKAFSYVQQIFKKMIPLIFVINYHNNTFDFKQPVAVYLYISN